MFTVNYAAQFTAFYRNKWSFSNWSQTFTKEKEAPGGKAALWNYSILFVPEFHLRAVPNFTLVTHLMSKHCY